MPGERQFAQHLVGQTGETEARDEALEVAPVQDVELGEGLPAGAHLLHAGLVFGAPGIGEGDPVEPMAERGQNPLRLAGDRGPPVHQGAEDVEKQGADAGDRGVCGA